jgi:hypothetical protein
MIMSIGLPEKKEVLGLYKACDKKHKARNAPEHATRKAL